MPPGWGALFALGLGVLCGVPFLDLPVGWWLGLDVVAVVACTAALWRVRKAVPAVDPFTSDPAARRVHNRQSLVFYTPGPLLLACHLLASERSVAAAVVVAATVAALYSALESTVRLDAHREMAPGPAPLVPLVQGSVPPEG